MHFLIGDLQGCSDALDRLLAEIDFSPSRDSLHVLGDLVNRGPDSVGVLQRLVALGGAATCLLGNHDLHLLAVAAGAQKPHRSDTLQAVLAHPQREAWLHWLRHCRMADRAHGWLLVHAGVLPHWSAEQTLALADEVHALLRSAQFDAFLPQMYGNLPARWDDTLQGPDRWRVDHQCVDAPALLHRRRDDGVHRQGQRRGGTAWLPTLVRRGAAAHAGRAGRIRPLVDPGAARAARVAVARHRLRVGWAADRGAHRRRPARTLSSALQTRLVARRG